MADVSADASAPLTPARLMPAPKSRRPLLPFATMAIAGALAASPSANALTNATILAALTLGLTAVAYRRSWREGATLGLFVALLTTALGFGLFTSWRTAKAANDVALIYPDGAKRIAFEGVVSRGTPSVAKRHDDDAEAPDLPRLFRGRDHTSRYYFLDLERDAEGRELSGRLKVYVRFGEDIMAGQRVIVTGDLKPLRGPSNWGESDQLEVAWRDGISASLYTSMPADSEPIAEHTTLARLAESYRFAVWDHVGSKMKIGNDALLAAIALGERTTLAPSERDNFVRTGTVHMLVVSGLHVFVLVWLIGFILRAIGVTSLRTREALRITVALLFLFVSGGHIATMRAVVMVILFSLARMRGRGHDAINTLAGAALLVTLFDPADVSSEGFALSFITVAAFLVFMPALGALQLGRHDDAERFDFNPWDTKNFVKQSLLSTLIASFVTMPIVVSKWNLITPVALIVNLLCMIPIIAILGASLLLPLSGIEWLAYVLAWFLDLMIGILRAIVEYASGIEGGVVFVPSPSQIWVWTVYAGLIIFGLLILRWLDAKSARPPLLKWLALGLLAIYAVMPLATEGPPDGPQLTLLDMRQGSAAYLRTPEGKIVLFDCGSLGRAQAGSQTVATTLLQSGVRHVEILVLSHDDLPAINGVAELLSRISVGEFWLSQDFDRNPAGAEAIAWLEKRGETLRFVDQGDSETLGECRLEVLWPRYADLDAISQRQDRSDSASIVIALHGSAQSVLITGGVDDMALKHLIPDLPQVDWLIAPRNGGKLTRADELLAQTQASGVIVSAREGFIKEASRTAYASAGRQLLETWRTGALQLRLDRREGWRPYHSAPAEAKMDIQE